MCLTIIRSRSNSSPISPVKWVCVERENARRKHRRHQQSSGPIVDSLPVVNVHLISVAGGALEVLFAFGNELSLVIERLVRDHCFAPSLTLMLNFVDAG